MSYSTIYVLATIVWTDRVNFFRTLIIFRWRDYLFLAMYVSRL